MCLPPIAMIAAATAMQTGGARLNQITSNKAIKRSLAGETERQRVFQQQADQQFQSSLDRFRPENSQQLITDATNKREQTIGGNLSLPDADNSGYAAMTANAPGVVKSSLAAKLADAVAQSKGQAQRLAKLGATGQVTFDNALDLDNSGMKLGTISNFSTGSKNVNMAEQAAAAQKRSGWGDALGVGGQLLNIGAGLKAGGAFNGPMAPTFAKTELPWRNTAFGYDIGGKAGAPSSWINLF